MDNNYMLPIGTILRNGKYIIQRHLGSGGFGKTYLVREVQTGKLFAVKEFFMQDCNLRNDTTVSVSMPSKQHDFDSQKSKFKKEAQRLQQLNHAHIVRVHESFEENGTAYYVMDFIDGGSLKDLLEKTNHPLAENKVISILEQILSALSEVHKRHISHMDIKPANILLDRNGCAYLIDFGASKLIESEGRYTSSVVPYTQGYAPTEQIEGKLANIGPWTDIYALGATLYNMLTLQKPPMSSDIMDYGDGAFTYPASVSMDMKKLIRWMMQPRRSERPQSVKEVSGFLHKYHLCTGETQYRGVERDEETQMSKEHQGINWPNCAENTVITNHGIGQKNNTSQDKLTKDSEQTIINNSVKESDCNVVNKYVKSKNDKVSFRLKLFVISGVLSLIIWFGYLGWSSRMQLERANQELKVALESNDIELLQKWLHVHSRHKDSDMVKRKIEEIRRLKQMEEHSNYMKKWNYDTYIKQALESDDTELLEKWIQEHPEDEIRLLQRWLELHPKHKKSDIIEKRIEEKQVENLLKYGASASFLRGWLDEHPTYSKRKELEERIKMMEQK